MYQYILYILSNWQSYLASPDTRSSDSSTEIRGALTISPPAFRPSDNWTRMFRSVGTESQKRLVQLSFATL